MSNNNDNQLNEKLQELETQRTKLLGQIKESQSVLEAIEDKIEMVKRQSKERLLKDDRVDNRLVMRAHGAAKVQPEEDSDGAFRLMTHVNRSSAQKERPASLITRELTEQEITVVPKEQQPPGNGNGKKKKSDKT